MRGSSTLESPRAPCYGLHGAGFEINAEEMKLDNPGKADVVLDPDLGYIYVPLADFRILNEKLTKIMTTDSQGHDVAPYLYPCQTQLGACVFNISCQEASTYMSDTGKSL